MRLNLEALCERAQWEDVDVKLPGFDVAAMREATRRAPIWVHFGAGNLFRGFVARLQQDLLNQGLTDRGIVAVDTSEDGALLREVYQPHDNLSLLVTLHDDGRADRQVIAGVAEAMALDAPRLEEIFGMPGLQIASFTITEKGYGNGSTMRRMAELLRARYESCARPIALMSLDNCSRNGEKLKEAVLSVVREWSDAPEGFLSYLEEQVSFPWTMIDKITPRPDAQIAASLANAGIEGMEVCPRPGRASVAAFVNAEPSEYLVIEDDFPNGRPCLERAGVLLGSREDVGLSERMKVTACLNPLHTGLAVLGCLLGYERISDEMRDPLLASLARRIGAEGLVVAPCPPFIEPEAFLEELLTRRLPNPNIPDTPQRIACDTSQKVPIRFGETLRAYRNRADLDMAKLTAIPLAIAGWLRYLLGVDDELRPMAVSPDPRSEELARLLAGVRVGAPNSCAGRLAPILSDAAIFGESLLGTPVADRIESDFAAMLAGAGAVRKTLRAVLED